MALTDITVTFNLTQLLGEAFDARRTRAYVKTNVANGTLMDTSTGEIRLGDQKVTIGDDGTGSFTTWAPGVDGNPTSWQTSLVVEYPRTGQRDRQVRTFGPYTITASADLADLEAEQAVPAEYLTQVTDELQTYSDAAAASASSASTSASQAQGFRDEAEALILADLGTTDGQTAALIDNPLSQTASSLSASIGVVLNDPDGPLPDAVDGIPRLSESALTEVFGRGISVKVFGATGDGATDDTAAIQDALDFIAAITPVDSRVYLRPTIFFPAGEYKITAGFDPILSRGLRVIGEGSMNTCLRVATASDVPFFDIGTFSTAPADIFLGGAQGVEFQGLRIQRDGTTPGARTGQGIRCSGGGSLVLRDVAVYGLKYGINSPYGGDFNTYYDVTAEFCDVGVYQGPGGQQFYAANLNAYACVEGLVLDRPGHVYMSKPVFNSCGTAGVVIEAFTDTTTRQLTTLPTGAISYQSQIVFDTAWFEGNAGDLGTDYIPTNYVEFRTGTASDTYRDIEFRNPIIHAGNNGSKTTTAFVAQVSGTLAAQRVRVLRPVFQGAMTRWFTSPNTTWLLDDLRVANGSTAPAYSADLGFVGRVTSAGSRIVGALPQTETYEQANGTHGVRVTYDVNGIIKYGFLNAGSYITRAVMDVQNRRHYLDDSANSNAFSTSVASAMPTTGTWGAGSFVFNRAPAISGGKILLGWSRLTSGSAHVSGTDWQAVYVTTS